MTLIEIAERGDYREFTEQLAAITAKTHGSHIRAPMTEDEKLLDEAYWRGYRRHSQVARQERGGSRGRSRGRQAHADR